MLLAVLSVLLAVVSCSYVMRKSVGLVRARRRSTRTDVIYDQLVRARVCRSSGFGSIKNGFGGIYVTVTPTAITVTAGGPGGKVVRLLGIEYILDPKATQMTRRRVGVMETNLFGRESVVIKGEDRKGELEIAIVPRDGDLERLERALIDVGASAGE